VSDEDAKRELAPAVEMNRSAARVAMTRTERSINPVADRAYRLIRAAVDDAPVPPVDPAKEPKVREIERWSQMPLRDVFQSLEPIVPGLGALGAQAEAWGAAHPSASQEQRLLQSLRISRKARRLLAKARNRDEVVLQCDLARRIALEYVAIALGDPSRGDASRSFAEIEATPITTTITWGRPPG
jgi:hypothetical protein